jgi:IclR family acetate operon transcriptional repressor
VINQNDTTRTERIHADVSAAPTSIHKAFHVLELLAVSDGSVSLGKIADACGLPKPSAVRLLQTLHDLGYVERPLDSREYRLGGRISIFSGTDPHRELKAAAHPWLSALHKEFNETVNLEILSGEKITYVDYLETSRPLRMIVAPGSDDLWDRTALGRAVVAAMPAAAREKLLERCTFGERDVAARLSRLSLMRRKIKSFIASGHAWEMEEAVEGAGCVAVSLAARGYPQAAISISVPIQRLGEERRAAMVSGLLKIAKPDRKTGK